jgi:hypothetical protein
MRTSSAARQFAASAPLTALLIVVLPALAAAQVPVTSFDQLNTRLKVGDTVWVTDAQGREVKGKITELHDASVTLDGDSQTTLRAADVRLVQRASKSFKKATLWGMVIGVGASIAVSAAADDGSGEADMAYGLGALLGAGMGAGVGAAVRAALPAGRKEVYRAPGASGSASLSLAPVITPRTKGVAVAYSF